MVGSPVQTVFFAGMSLIPVWIFVIGLSVSFIKIFAYIIFIFIGFLFYTALVMDELYAVGVRFIRHAPTSKKPKKKRKAKRTPRAGQGG